MSKDKKKKNTTVYYDDGRTIADMSALSGKRRDCGNVSPSYGKRASLKEQAKTYFAAVRMMFVPMLAVMAAICVLFLILYVILELAS